MAQPSRRLALVLTAFAAACGGVDETADVADEQDLATELSATAGDLTVTVTTATARRGSGSSQRWVVSGKASKDLASVRTWVPDDPFCTAKLTAARSFEIACDAGHELNSLLSGLPLFLDVQPKSGSRASVRLDLAPHFVGAAGTTRLWIGSVVRPVAARGGLVYRGSVRADAGVPLAVEGAAAGKLLPVRRNARDWNLDGVFDKLKPLFAPAGSSASRIELVMDHEGTPRKKSATLTVVVSGVVATTGDAAAQWPSQACTTAVRSCLGATPAGTTDFGDCGTYREVMACGLPHQLPRLLATPDDMTALNAALRTVRAALPASKAVDVAGFVVDARTAPAIALVARAYADQAAPASAVIGATLTEAKVKALLAEFGAQELLPAAQQVVYQKSFRAIRVDSKQRVNGREEATAHVLLHFPAAARLIAIELTTR